MDQIQIGKFIASLRKQANMTQEALGELLGVTNKTISRWETGSYMPDIEMLQLLGKTFDVSLNELLAGKRLTDTEYRKAADENLAAVAKAPRAGSFSDREKREYYIRKWRKEHISLYILSGIVVLAVLLLPLRWGRTELMCLAVLPLAVFRIILRSRMMAYVESRLYDDRLS